jgi:hypothetical protein
MATSEWFAEYESEGDHEQFIAQIVVNVQDPAAPIFQTPHRGEGSHDTGPLITRLNEVGYHGAAPIDQGLPPVRAMEIYLGHFHSP